ncbi:PREDICTED: TSK-associating protein 1 isoform X1 [Tarenaya hassleriana]|uniref:TSK-associating protein 1 isoform X1 n=1 Tax=Tarenaya hassleriana TaxID=28532 RepID=UPI00053C7FC9|nr:PREDICTED: TSK-associating protein 1 isoform X1 [Tarenaya hassleriana]
MGDKFLVLGLFLSLVLASFTEVSCQYEAVGDEGNRGLSMLDLIEHEYQSDVGGRKQPNLDGLDKDKDSEDQTAKKQSETQPTGQKNTTASEKTISLSLLDESEGSLNDTYDKPLETKSTEHEATGSEGGIVDQFDLEYQALVNGLKQTGSDEVKTDKDVEEQVSKKSMLDEIELEYKETINGLKQSTADESSNVGEDEELSKLRLSMLEEIEREHQASKKLKIDDFTGGKNDEELSAKRASMLDEIEREYEAAAAGLKELMIDLNQGNDGEDQSAKRQSMLEEIEREYEAAAKGLEQLKADFSGGNDDSELSAKRISMLDEIEREYEAAASSLEKLKVDFSESKGDDEEQSAKRQSMLEEIEREYEAAASSLEHLRADFSENKDGEEQSAKRQSMLDEIEREYEAAAKGIHQLKVDFTEGKDDSEQSAKRQSMLDEIEREYEEAAKSLHQLRVDFTEGKDDEEQSAKTKSMLDEIEREYEEAAKSLHQLRVDFTEGKDDGEQSAKRQSMLDEIEREYEEAAKNLKELRVELSKGGEEQAAKRRSMLDEIEREYEAAVSDGKPTTEQSGKKRSGSSTFDFFEIEQSAGVCGCFNQHSLGGGLKEDKEASIVIPRTINIDELIKDDISIQSSESSSKTTVSKTSSLTTSLSQLVENHKNPKVVVPSRIGSSFELSSTGQTESLRKTERTETLKAKIKALRGVTVQELVTRSEFNGILAAVSSLEELDSVSVSYISRLARYKTVIEEGIEASNRVHMAQSRAKILKEMAKEKQAVVETDIESAKGLAQKGDELYVKIVAIKKLLAKLEAEKEAVDAKFQELVTRLMHLMEEASHAQEDYQAAFRKAKEEEAALEFAREAAENAQRIWLLFLDSL